MSGSVPRNTSLPLSSSYCPLMSSSPLRSCPSLPHRPRHRVFPIPLTLSLYRGLSCCAAMRWIDRLAWLQILPPNRHKSSPEREANRTMCCIIKSAVLPGGITARSERARGKRGESKNPRKHTNMGGVHYFHNRSDYLKKTKQKQAYNGQIHL